MGRLWPLYRLLAWQMSVQNYFASMRGGSTISPAVYKKQFLPLDSGAEFFSSDLIVPVTRPSVTYLQAEPNYIRTYAGLFFSLLIQAPVMRTATHTDSGQ